MSTISSLQSHSVDNGSKAYLPLKQQFPLLAGPDRLAQHSNGLTMAEGYGVIVGMAHWTRMIGGLSIQRTSNANHRCIRTDHAPAGPVRRMVSAGPRPATPGPGAGQARNAPGGRQPPPSPGPGTHPRCPSTRPSPARHKAPSSRPITKHRHLGPPPSTANC